VGHDDVAQAVAGGDRLSTAEGHVAAAKLIPPQVSAPFVARPRLVTLLDHATRGPVTVLSAGPGSGKTQLLASWRTEGRAPGSVAWLSLDPADNDPARFWGSVLAALSASGAVGAGDPLDALRVPSAVDARFLDRIIGGLADLPGPVVLVLDDFHEITDTAVLDAVADLLRHLPAQLRLVFATRADPPLPMYRLRLAGELTEIRAADLAFGPHEATQLFAGHGLPLDRAQVVTLLTRTEGWAAGLRLAAMSLVDCDDIDRGVATYAGDDRSVAEYLIAEVLCRLDPQVQRFLLRTCVSDRLCGDLADAMTGRRGGGQLLERLVQDNAFVSGLGDRPAWYRYHPMFAEVLRHRLSVESPAEVPELHAAAAQWFADHGEPIEAVRHAMAGADWRLAGTIIGRVGVPLMLSANRQTLSRLLDQLPARPTGAADEAAAVVAGAAHRPAETDQLAIQIGLAGRLIDDLPPAERRKLAAARRLLALGVARLGGDIDAMSEAADDVLRLVGADLVPDPRMTEQYRSIALTNKGAAQAWTGQTMDAVRTLHSALIAAELAGLELVELNSLSYLALVHAIDGRLRSADALVRQAIRFADDRGWRSEMQIGAAYLAAVIVHLERWEIDEARGLLESELTPIEPSIEPALAHAAGLVRARVLAVTGDFDGARAEVARVRRRYGGSAAPGVLRRWGRVVEVEIDLAAGDPAAALSRLERLSEPAPAIHRDRVLKARAHLALGSPHEADDVLRPVRNGSSVDHVVLIHSWLTEALIADRLREDSRALDCLSRALALAEDEQIRLPFHLLGSRLRAMLSRHVQVGGGHHEFVSTMLGVRATVGSGVARRPPRWPDPLTDRELTMLRFLPTMRSNSEIAQELCVSPNTVKAHLKTLFRKLAVSTRRDAVRRARELGLLPEVSATGSDGRLPVHPLLAGTPAVGRVVGRPDPTADLDEFQAEGLHTRQ
jgi:LuxR family maltose regulon positive regulatory protein